MIIKKHIKIICFAFALIFLLEKSLFSLETQRQPSIEEQIRELRDKLDSITGKNALDEEGVVASNANPTLIGKPWYAMLDILLWKARIAGSEYAYTNDQPSLGRPIKGHIGDLQFPFDFGFRMGIGRSFDHDKWGSDLVFTYFRTDDSSKVEGNETNIIIPLRGPFAAAAQRATSQMDFDFYNLDLDLYRYYFISKALSLKPSIGIRNTWADLHQIIRYTGGSVLGYNTAETNDTCKVWGMGPKLGVQTTWSLEKGFNVYGIFSASLIYGFYKVSDKSNITPTGDFDFIIKESRHRFIPNGQYNIGLGWNGYIYDKQYFLDLKLGYEGIYYWRLNQMLHFEKYDSSIRFYNTSEDVSLHGVTFKIRLFY